ncbi:hypothetical protein FRB96_007600 [Tulasnella sp. 330]|nr:hypothetical protein FRB96_007600 [Tulasnella sp. 330]KAG8884180.1 hypothetical protein FRB97_004959 [Tulasnella sp. 331]KAG8889139.1 hypothetical protein FRB98_005614 [Tulasnella sp. 332]
MDLGSGSSKGLRCEDDPYCVDPSDPRKTFLHKADTHDFMTAEDDSPPPKPSRAVPLVYVVVMICVLWIVYVNVARQYSMYKRKREVRDRRRRAGIPDDDDRPFDVAYSAAALARRRETEERQKAEQEQARLDAESNTPFAQMAGSFESRLPYNVRMQGLQPPSGLVHRQVTNPRARGFSPAPEVQQFRSQGAFLQPIQPQQQSLRYHYSNGDAATITSSESPPGQGAPPPVWEDQYAPPSVRAVNERTRARQAAAAATTTSTLGRRSRKDLHFGNDSEIENEAASRQQRLRTGAQSAKDADDEAKFIGRGRTRKRGQDPEDTEDQDNNRANPRRRVDDSEDARTMPGALPEMQPAGPIAGKRKAAEDQGETAQDSETVEGPRKPRKKVKRGKEKATREEAEDDAAPEVEKKEAPSRQPGEEWMADGVKYKMADNGDVLREAVIQERKTVVPVKDDKLSPTRRTPTTKTIYHSFVRSWMTQADFEKAKSEGRISAVFKEDAFMAEVHRQSSPLHGSDMEDDIRSETGQTPLNTGAYRTKLGYDRPIAASPSLMNMMKQSADDLRRQHMHSPVRKNFMPSKRGATMTRTERARAEEEAWADVRKGWRQTNAKNAPAPSPSVVSAPPVTKKDSNPFAPVAPAPSASKSEGTIVPQSAAAPTVPTLTITPATAPLPKDPNPAPKPALFSVTVPEKKDAEPAKPPLFTMPSFSAPTPSTATSSAALAPVSNEAAKPSLFNFAATKPTEPEPKPAASMLFSGGFSSNNTNPPPATANKPPSLFGPNFGNSNNASAPTAPLFGLTPPTATTPNTGPAASEQKQPSNTLAATAPAQVAPQTQPFSMPSTTPAQPSFQFPPAPLFGAKAPPAINTSVTSNSLNGAPGNQNPFGPSQPSSTGQMTGFGGSSGGAAPAEAPKFSFGGGAFGSGTLAPKSTGAGGLFGSGTMAPVTAAPSGLFGGGIGGFGSQQPTTTTPGSSQPSNSSLSIFGAAKTGDAQNNTAKPSFSFGQPAAPTAPSASPFGQSPSTLFGNSASAVATPAATQTTFGNQPSSGFTFGAGFGGAQNNTTAATPSSPFGQPTTPQAGTPGQVPGSATAPVFNIGTPPPAQRTFKGMPRSRR